MATKVDTAYRMMSLTTLCALRDSTLVIIKSVEGTGQSHTLNGRNITQADRAKAMEDLVSIEAAIDYKGNPANAGNKGYASRYASFNTCRGY